MSESRLFTVRPLPVQLRNDLKDCFRVYLSASSLASLKLRSGDLCSLQLPDMPPRTAIAWAALENIQNTVVQTSKILQDCYGFKLGDKLIMKRVDGQLEEADSVQLEECTDPSRLSIYGLLPSPEKDHWEWCLEYPVSRCGILSAGLVFEMDLKGHRRSFKVVEILVRNRTGSNTIYQFSKISTISIRNQGILKHGIELQVQTSSLEGVSSQVRRINECLVDFNSNVQRLSMPSFYEHTCGILIYGPKGTGKTALLRQIEAAGWRQSFTIGSSTLHRNVEDGGAHLRRIFQAALLSQPSVIIIDQVEFIAPRRMSLETSSLAYVLCEGIETLRTAKVLVVAATRHPNDVDDSLRTPHRLAVEIELSVPTAEARSGILRAIRGSCGEPSDRLIDFIARKTHGYVGADLFALLQLTCRKARNRELSKGEPLENFDISVPEATSFEAPPQLNGASLLLRIQEKDILSAMQEIRPTAMREVFLETPKVKWSDIGGQHEIKKRLQNVVQRPLKVGVPIEKLLGMNITDYRSFRIECEGSMLTAKRVFCCMALQVAPRP
jgi:AAA family ATPase